jgi:hypothetical protein
MSIRSTYDGQGQHGALYRPGDLVEVHTASCYTPTQHQQVTQRGTVLEVVPGPALVVLLDDGTEVELFPGDSPHWHPGSCPALDGASAHERAPLPAGHQARRDPGSTLGRSTSQGRLAAGAALAHQAGPVSAPPPGAAPGSAADDKERQWTLPVG